MRPVRDVISSNAVVIRENATVEEAIHCLLEHRVSGVPVVDQQGSLVGIISEFQLIEAVYRPDVKREQVRDLMTKDVITVGQDADISEVANLLLLHRIRRVPVVHEGKVLGVIARNDLLRCTVDAECTQAHAANEVKACSCGQ